MTTANQLSFGPVLKTEIAAVAHLEVSAFAPPVYPVFFFRQAFDLWPEMFWVARRGNQILAYLLCAPELKDVSRFNLLSFAVAPEAQGQGIGKLLLQAFLQQLPLLVPAAQCLWLTVDPENTAAIRLYQQHGFVQCAQEADYYGTGYYRLVLSAQIGGNSC